MHNTFTDQELLSLLVKGDRHAFELIYLRYWNDLYNTAYRRLKNTRQSEDIVQEIFIRLWERRFEIQIENLSAYLHTSVRYKVYNYVSRNAAADSFYELFDNIAVYPVCADATVREKELLQLVTDYIAALPQKRKKIFSLYYNEDLSTKEIAQRLSISQKTVQNQLSLAMKGLRTEMLPTLIFLVSLIALIQ